MGSVIILIILIILFWGCRKVYYRFFPERTPSSGANSYRESLQSRKETLENMLNDDTNIAGYDSLAEKDGLRKEYEEICSQLDVSSEEKNT